MWTKWMGLDIVCLITAKTSNISTQLIMNTGRPYKVQFEV